MEECAARLLESFSSDPSSHSNRRKIVVVRHDVAYTHRVGMQTCHILSVSLVSQILPVAGEIVTRLREALHPESQVTYTIIPNKLLPPSSAKTSENVESSGSPRMPETVQDCTIFYVGDESLGLTNLLITHSSCDVSFSERFPFRVS